MIPPELVAKKGDWVKSKWIELLKWIDKTNRVIAGAGVRVQNMPSGGLYISADPSSSVWASPFEASIVSVGKTHRLRVSPGAVNGVIPTIEGVRINGIDDKGATVRVPQLEVLPPSGNRSNVYLRLAMGPDFMAFDPDDPRAATIVHGEPIKEDSEGGAIIRDGAVLYALSAIYWRDGKVVRTFQIVHHNLNHRYVQAMDGRPSRHLFWAA